MTIHAYASFQRSTLCVQSLCFVQARGRTIYINHHMLSYENELQAKKFTKEILLCMLLYSFISGNIDFYAINEERRKCRYSKMYFGSQCVKGKIQGVMRYHLRGLRSVLYDQYCAISNVSGHILPAKMPFSLLVCSS